MQFADDEGPVRPPVIQGWGIDPHVCLDIVLSLNVTHCTPSLPEQEILIIVASIARREFAQRTTRRKESNRG
jgi:hypothetical protein